MPTLICAACGRRWHVRTWHHAKPEDLRCACGGELGKAVLPDGPPPGVAPAPAPPTAAKDEEVACVLCGRGRRLRSPRCRVTTLPETYTCQVRTLAAGHGFDEARVVSVIVPAFAAVCWHHEPARLVYLDRPVTPFVDQALCAGVV